MLEKRSNDKLFEERPSTGGSASSTTLYSDIRYEMSGGMSARETRDDCVVEDVKPVGDST